jgi:tRNA isopentenyl-2-thiomethyl-A-37 hydroxylase MiaE
VFQARANQQSSRLITGLLVKLKERHSPRDYLDGYIAGVNAAIRELERLRSLASQVESGLAREADEFLRREFEKTT